MCVPQNVNSVVFLYLQKEPQVIHLPPLFAAGPGRIDACGLHAGVAQDIRQAHDVLVLFIIGPGEQMPEVVGNTFPKATPARFARAFMLFQILLLSMGFPLPVTKTHPVFMPFRLQYLSKSLHSPLGNGMMRIFPLERISA